MNIVNLIQDNKYVEDIEDDILGNFDKDLYDFIEGDVVRAFWTGYILPEMLKSDDLEIDQYLLYSKQFRHCDDDLDKYEKQLTYWEKQYLEISDHPKTLNVLSYVLSNMIFLSAKDELNMYLTFGKRFYNSEHKKK